MTARLLRLAACVTALWCAAGPARAELDQKTYDSAAFVVRQFAAEMTQLVPCAYIAFAGMKPQADPVENTYGLLAVTAAVEKLIARAGGTPAQGAALVGLFEQGFKPEYTQDIRELSRKCTDSGMLQDMMYFRGPGLPLNLRPPFNGQ